MIILITGASHAGKTYLSQRMLEKYKYPYLSIDHLKMGLIRSGNTTLTPMDDEALTEYLWPIVREMVKTAIENEQNLIVEGCYIPADWRKDFEPEYLEYLEFICLAMTKEYIDAHFDDIFLHESAVETRMTQGDYTKEELKQSNRDFAESFRAAGDRVVLIDEDFEKTMDGLFECFDRIIGSNEKVNSV